MNLLQRLIQGVTLKTILNPKLDSSLQTSWFSSGLSPAEE